jgi:hypothetical protein
MAITILSPVPALPAAPIQPHEDEDAFVLESDEDYDMDDARPMKKPRTSKHVVTPGELVTDDAQWMR